MLNDKEKLIELLKQGEDATPCSFDEEVECDGIKCSDCERESMADYLIANGVTVQKKGEWKGTGNRHWDGAELMRCSVCGCVTKGDYMKFCPSCGADMRGEEHG